MEAAVAVVDLPGGIAALLPHRARTDPAIEAAPGETHELLIGRWRHFGVVSFMKAPSWSSHLLQVRYPETTLQSSTRMLSKKKITQFVHVHTYRAKFL